MDVYHSVNRLTEEHVTCAEQTGRSVDLDGVHTLDELLLLRVIDAYLHFLALIIHLTGLCVDQLLTAHLEDPLLLRCEKDTVRSLYPDIDGHRAFWRYRVLYKEEAGPELLDTAAAVGILVGCVDTCNIDTAALNLRALSHELGVLVGSLAEFLITLVGLLCLLPGLLCILAESHIQGIERIYLENIMLHDRAESSELFLVLPYLASVGGIGLLDAVQQLGDLLLLAVQLDIEAVIVGRELGILSLQLYQLIGQVLLIDGQVIDHLLTVIPYIGEHQGQHYGYHSKHYHRNFQLTVAVVIIVPSDFNLRSFLRTVRVFLVDFFHTVENKLFVRAKIIRFAIFVTNLIKTVIQIMNPKAKRVIRSVKYFFIFIVLVSIFVCILVLLTPHHTYEHIFATSPEDTRALFKYGSWWQMLVIFALIAAIYPGLTFVKKEVMIEGDFEDHRDKIMKEFEQAGYVKTDEDEEKLTFRIKNKFTRFMRAYEDTVTITKGEAPLILSGNRKDILRLASRIEYALRQDDGTTPDNPYDFSGTADEGTEAESTENQEQK